MKYYIKIKAIVPHDPNYFNQDLLVCLGFINKATSKLELSWNETNKVNEYEMLVSGIDDVQLSFIDHFLNTIVKSKGVILDLIVKETDGVNSTSEVNINRPIFIDNHHTVYIDTNGILTVSCDQNPLFLFELYSDGNDWIIDSEPVRDIISMSRVNMTEHQKLRYKLDSSIAKLKEFVETRPVL